MSVNADRASPDRLRCPSCHAAPLTMLKDALRCTSCSSVYPFDLSRGVVSMMRSGDSDKANIRTFWGDLAQQWYAENDKSLTRDSLLTQLDAVEAFFRRRQQMAVVEMPIDHLAGLEVLEIGAGGGAHSALFKRKGARMTALDITPERVLSTALKLKLLDGPPSLAVEGDSENLPFEDNSFDIVYSNGVLHHSVNTYKCVDEVYRVLKPGGRAIIMLYARHSTQYWFNLVPRMLLNGTLFTLPEAEAMGRITEGRPKFREQKNPYTRVYSLREIENLFAKFLIESVRKSSFRLDYVLLPKAYLVRRAILKLFGVPDTPAGTILYGQPMAIDCGLELALSPYVGWCMNISARKPSQV